MGEISTFAGRFFFLSNFYPTPVEYEGVRYPSSECAYQAAKSEDIQIRLLYTTMTPSQAKRAWRLLKYPLRPNWEAIKNDIMLEVVRAKFQHPALALLLVGTHPYELIEGNDHEDKYWGVYSGKGLNHLGKILMQVRSELIEKNRNKS
jgi:hypothetical protein